VSLFCSVRLILLFMTSTAAAAEFSIQNSTTPFAAFFGRKKRGSVNGTKAAGNNPRPMPPPTQSTNVFGTVNGTTTRHFADMDLQSNFVSSSQAKENHLRPAAEKQKRIESLDSGILSDGDIPYYGKSLQAMTRANAANSSPGDKKRNYHRQNRLSGLLNSMKAMSADEIYLTDPRMLIEALEVLGEDQPRVARSIPRHAAVVDSKVFASKSLNNCLFDAAVYDSMLEQSMMVCSSLQSHLSDCIASVRAKNDEEKPNICTGR